jgi:hypothetical protein
MLTACSDEPPTPEGLCARAASCEPMDVLVSRDSCMQQVRARLINASPTCSECVLGLPCSGMARVASGKVALSQICPACPSSVTAKAECTKGHEHVLICGIAARPPASASASAAAAAPTATATATATAIPSAVPSAAPAAAKPPSAPLAPLPSVAPLPTAPVPARPP